MKKVISFVLAFTMLFSCCTFSQAGVFAASKTYAADKLVEIQKTSGFVPGSRAVVVGNCYLFVAAVCEKLYGVTYDGEGLYGNYKSHHYSGNYYTVSTFTTANRTPTSSDVENIISFFINNATPGDIIHFGSYDQSISKTHTIMINSISTEKMSIYHSNYNIAQHSSSDCHVDNIYWDSFRENPTRTIYNSDGTLYSINALFYNTMKLGGVGITINRYKNYENKYYLVNASVPNLRVSRTSCTSMELKWDKIAAAEKYKIQYKKAGDKYYTTLSENYKKCKYTIKDLTLGTKYYFRVSAFIGTKFMDFSKVVSKEAKPPALTKLRFSAEKTGLRLNWNALSDITGVRIRKSDSKNGTYSIIKTISDNTVDTYLDKNVKYNKSYYYKIERYVKSDGKEYKTIANPIEGKYLLSTPEITYKNKSATSVDITVKPNGTYSQFNYYLTNSSGKKVVSLTKTTDNKITLNGLSPGEKYDFSCRQTTSIGNGEYTTLSFTAKPKKEEITSVSQTSTGIKISYSTEKDVDGYIVYRCASQFGKYKTLKTVENKDISSVIDGDVEYNKEYFYKVRSYVNKGSNRITSNISDASNGIKIKLAKPKNIKITRTSPTSMTIKWDAVENADRYIVEFKREGGEWKELKQVKTNKKVKEDLILGKVYYFRVKAGNKIGWGAFSSSASKQALPPTPAAPVLENTENGIRVNWKKMEGVSGVLIYRASAKNGKYYLLKTVANPNATRFTDKSVYKDREYFYKTVRFVIKGNKTYTSSKSKYSSIVRS